MSVQDSTTENALDQVTDPASPLEDDVEAHGAKEWIAGLSTAVVLTGAGAGVAAASMSGTPDPRGTAHAAIDATFDTAETGIDLANNTAQSAQDRATQLAESAQDAARDAADAAQDTAVDTADRALDAAQSTAEYASALADSTRDAAFDRLDQTLDDADAAIDDAYATASSLSAPVREIVRDIVQNAGDVDTTTRVVSTMPRSFAGQAVTLTAAVLPGEARTSTVTGRVTFLDGTAKLGTTTLSPGGVATLTTANLSAGDHDIRAIYHGDSIYNGSVSQRADQDVVKASTVTAVRSSAARAEQGTLVRLTATVASAHPGALVPSGSVTFWSADTKLGVGRIGPDGTASISTSSLGEGVHDVVAQYAGDTMHAASESLPLPQVVLEAPSASVSTQDGQVTITVSAAGYDTSISAGPKSSL